MKTVAVPLQFSRMSQISEMEADIGPNTENGSGFCCARVDDPSASPSWAESLATKSGHRAGSMTCP